VVASRGRIESWREIRRERNVLARGVYVGAEAPSPKTQSERALCAAIMSEPLEGQGKLDLRAPKN